jgi:valyl-tRNA synthetase
MAGNPGGARIDWTQEEFDRLAELVLEMVSKGYSVTDACEAFEKETGGVRSAAAARYKWNVLLSNEYEELYKLAKLEGQKARAQNAKEQRRRIKIRPTVSRAITTQQQTDEDAPVRMTQRELIRFLRSIEIVGDDVVNKEQIQKQLDEVVRERDELKRQLEAMTKKYEEVKAELDSVIAAMNVARKYAAGIEDTQPKKYVIGKDGFVESV